MVAAAPVAAVLLAFSLFLTMLRQSRPRAPEPVRGQGRVQEPADDLADQPTAPMMVSAVDAVPLLATSHTPRPPAPPIALPAAPVPALADRPAADSDQAPDAATVVAEVPEAAPTQEIPAPAADSSDADSDPGTAATREEPAFAPTAPTAPEATRPPASQQEDADPPWPGAVAPESTPEAPAEPTGEPTGEVPVEPTPKPVQPPAPTPSPQAIRYASSAAAEQYGDEDWEAEVDPALAGQVYPVLTSDPDIEVPPHGPGEPQDLEDDAPPFATAPFASVPAPQPGTGHPDSADRRRRRKLAARV